MLPRRRSRPLAAALLLAVVAGCAQDDGEVAALREEVEALRVAGDERAEEVGQLRDELDRLLGSADDDQAPLDELREELDALEGRLTELAEARPDRDEVGELARAPAEELGSDLRGSLETVRGTLDQVRGEVDELRTLYEVLRERVDRIDERT